MVCLGPNDLTCFFANRMFISSCSVSAVTQKVVLEKQKKIIMRRWRSSALCIFMRMCVRWEDGLACCVTVVVALSCQSVLRVSLPWKNVFALPFGEALRH